MVTPPSTARGDMVGLTCASATTIVPSHGSLPASRVGISVTPSPYGTKLQGEGAPGRANTTLLVWELPEQELLLPLLGPIYLYNRLPHVLTSPSTPQVGFGFSCS